MKIKSKKFGHSLNMSNKQYADFIYAKAYNQDGKFKSLNTSEDYIVVNESKVSNTKFYLTCIGLTVLSIASILLHIQWNY